MCEDVWGMKGADLCSHGECPSKWIKFLAKVSETEAHSRFNAADKDGSGDLDSDEFIGVASEICPSMGQGELRAMLSFVDANRDGRVNYEEFMMWLTATKGAYITPPGVDGVYAQRFDHEWGEEEKWVKNDEFQNATNYSAHT
jgi:Ca2+-binding EF-hand superfamily protein